MSGENIVCLRDSVCVHLCINVLPAFSHRGHLPSLLAFYRQKLINKNVHNIAHTYLIIAINAAVNSNAAVQGKHKTSFNILIMLLLTK